jgi:hypothetical protein
MKPSLSTERVRMERKELFGRHDGDYLAGTFLFSD